MLGACKRVFSQCLVIARSSNMCHPSSYSPRLPGACCLELSGGSLWRSYGERVLAGLLKTWENICCFSWTTLPWFWVLRRVVVACQTSTILVAKFCVISLATFIIPLCTGFRQKIIRPTSHLAPSVAARAMYSDVDQCRPSATGSALDAELLAVLSAEAAQVASEETQTRMQSASRSCIAVTDQNRGRMEAGSQATRRKRSTPLRRVWLVSIPSSASGPSSSRTESSQPRSNVTRPRSTSSWPLRKCRWTS